ncbi:hypothetical protein K2X33_03825, partial [bacterium]|nr:hypothetical protein [bacterium]
MFRGLGTTLAFWAALGACAPVWAQEHNPGSDSGQGEQAENDGDAPLTESQLKTVKVVTEEVRKAIGSLDTKLFGEQKKDASAEEKAKRENIGKLLESVLTSGDLKDVQGKLEELGMERADIKKIYDTMKSKEGDATLTKSDKILMKHLEDRLLEYQQKDALNQVDNALGEAQNWLSGVLPEGYVDPSQGFQQLGGSFTPIPWEDVHTAGKEEQAPASQKTGDAGGGSGGAAKSAASGSSSSSGSGSSGGSSSTEGGINLAELSPAAWQNT